MIRYDEGESGTKEAEDLELAEVRLLEVSEIDDLDENVDLELNDDQDELLLEIELCDSELIDDFDSGVELEVVFSQ